MIPFPFQAGQLGYVPAVQASGGATDPFFSSVVLLAHMDGTDSSTTFTDSSSYARTLTAAGTGRLSTTSPKFGTACGLFDSTGGQVSTPNSAQFAYGTGDFTYEFWMRPDNVTGIKDVIQKYGSVNPDSVAIQQRAAKLHLLVSFNGSTWGIDQAGTSDVLTIGTWTFVQLVRASGVFTMYADGVQTLTNSSFTASSIGNSSNALIMGRSPTAGNAYIGRLDDVRITTGVARANAVPTAAFPNS